MRGLIGSRGRRGGGMILWCCFWRGIREGRGGRKGVRGGWCIKGWWN